jgi:hypothetical protein
MVVVGHDPIRHGSNFEIFLRSPSHGRSASERACTSELACCEPLLRLSVEFPRAHLVAVHCWVSAWENGESNCVVNERAKAGFLKCLTSCTMQRSLRRWRVISPGNRPMRSFSMTPTQYRKYSIRGSRKVYRRQEQCHVVWN